MKLTRLIAASIVGISLLAPATSAFACDHDSHSWSWFGWCSHDDKDKDCDHKDKDCDHNKNGGHDCNHGGSSSGGSSSGGGSSTSGGGSSTSGGGSSVGPKG
jgi:uncharacterized membrane protein YgcG